MIVLNPQIAVRAATCTGLVRRLHNWPADTFELIVNENYKLQNEAKMNVMFERGSARNPRRSPLSAELNDAST